MPTAPFLNLARDTRWGVGRYVAGGGTVYYTVPGVMVTSTGTLGGTLNTVFYWPLFVRTPLLIDRLALEVTTLHVGGNVRIGTYRADDDYQPVGGPLIDSGSISTTTTGVKTFDPSTPVMLQPGRYLSALNVDNATPQFRKFVGAALDAMVRDTITSTPFQAYVQASQTYGAFPTPGTAWTSAVHTTSGWEHMFVYRIKQ